MTPVVVFDTNILISGTSWRGRPFECLELARYGLIEACTCEEIIAEFRKVMKDKLHVITGDARHLLPLRVYKSISIITPAEFLRSVLPQAK